MPLRPEQFAAQVFEAAARYQRVGVGERERMCALWELLSSDPARLLGTAITKNAFMVPRFVTPPTSGMQFFCPIFRTAHPYCVGAVDGSQVYPDHHEGVPFFLLHTAALLFTYGVEATQSSFTSTMESAVYSVHDHHVGGAHLASPTGVVDSMRTEREPRAGLQLAQGRGELFPLLFDGSLIFWHLGGQNAVRDPFFGAYCRVLEACVQERILTAWYTSLPQGTDLVNLVRAVFPDETVSGHRTVVDSDLLAASLLPRQRTPLFFSGTDIAGCYPVNLRPAFFYLNTGDEIARIEVPAWIAQRTDLCDVLAGIIIDQCHKGQGYPLCLAEAHEHAVVRGGDRQLFFDCARRALELKGQGRSISRKAFNKRRAGF